ncbi:uncharacterized protein LOC119617384 [Kryptolebias marmoratus]|uniref:uncharacterized protein LOC119617384 n=1 Tax=Kryptolebias marmoratus TaxID=37003 RepID=UPI0018AD0DC4|nr:uncharacterized protein LOC119617384 [Kryptolebias marmoratus]XP_037833552.1 uncharacterized protein LOC119617384 [Kryptolebias marmoratus]
MEQNHHLCSGRDSDMDTADDNKHMERMEMETEEAHKVPDETHGHLPASEEPIGSCRGDRGSFRPRLLATKSFPPYSQCIGGLGEDGDWDNEPSLEPNTTPCQSNEKEDTHEDIQDTERKADVTAKCSREVLRAKWRARRKEKLGSSFEVGTDGWERGRWSGKRRVEESGKETEHENEERAEGPNSEGKHWRGRSSGLEKEEEEEGRKVSASSAAQQENSISLETPKEHSEEMMEPSMHRHPILSKLLHSSSTSSSCSSINLSSGESEEVFSEGEDATLKRKTFKKSRSWKTFLTMMHWSHRRQSSWVQLAGHQGMCVTHHSHCSHSGIPESETPHRFPHHSVAFRDQLVQIWKREMTRVSLHCCSRCESNDLTQFQ